MNIRIACETDIHAIAKVQVASWRTTYKGIVPQKFLDDMSVEERENIWAQVAAIHSVFVAEDEEGNIIGFAAGWEERTKNYPEYRGELYAIYLLEEYQKQGVGQKLFNYVVSDLKQSGHQSMLIWALSKNPACQFYEKMGGIIVDKVMDDIGGESLQETAYGWKWS